ncbi:MAG: hypothetical protein NVSMB17_09120 [Candidatus Dormibacteria bacterium]
MVVIPALTTLVSLVFAGQVLSQYRERRRLHQLAWGLALLFYAVAAFPEVLGSMSRWNDLDFRLYYLFGAILLVPWLALGTSELLLQSKRARWARIAYRGVVAVISVLGIVAIAGAPLHAHHLGGTQVPSNCAMWCKSESGYVLANGLAALSAAVGNTIGTVVLVAGAGYSAYRTYRAGLPRNLTLGNLLILAGSLVVATAATVTRLGSYELFYVAQAAGITIIFGGFLLIGSVTQARTRLA